MKQEFTLGELAERVALLNDCFDRVQLIDPVAEQILNPATLEVIGVWEVRTDDVFAERAELETIRISHRQTRVMNRDGKSIYVQYDFVRVGERKLVLVLENSLVGTHTMDNGGIAATVRSVDDYNRNLYRDYVTGAYNRQYLDTVYANEMRKMAAEGKPVCFAVVSVDHMNEIHNKYGRSAMDMVLGHVVGVCRQQLDLSCPDGIVARLGGSSVVLSCVGTDYETFTDAIRAVQQNHKFICVVQIYKRIEFTISISAADWKEAPEWNAMSELLDRRLMKARTEGGNRLVEA